MRKWLKITVIIVIVLVLIIPTYIYLYSSVIKNESNDVNVYLHLPSNTTGSNYFKSYGISNYVNIDNEHYGTWSFTINVTNIDVFASQNEDMIIVNMACLGVDFNVSSPIKPQYIEIGGYTAPYSSILNFGFGNIRYGLGINLYPSGTHSSMKKVDLTVT